MFYFIVLDQRLTQQAREAYRTKIGASDTIYNVSESDYLYATDSERNLKSFQELIDEAFQGFTCKAFTPTEKTTLASFKAWREGYTSWATNYARDWQSEYIHKKPLSGARKERPPIAIKVGESGKETNLGAERFYTSNSWDDLIGADTIRLQCDSLMAGVEYRIAAKSLGLRASEGHNNILIVGPAGVGKTTIAKIVALHLADSIYPFYNPSAVFIEAARFIARYLGQSKGNAKAFIEGCRNDVAVIDELDQLLSDDYGNDVLNAINNLTGNRVNSPIMVATAYETNLESLFRVNAGLSSRFPHIIRISGYSDQTLQDIFKLKLEREGYEAGGNITGKAGELLQALRFAKGANFANGREVDNIWSKIIDNRALRFKKSGHLRHDIENLSEDQKIDLKKKFVTITLEEMPDYDRKIGELTFSANAHKRPAEPRSNDKSVVALHPAQKAVNNGD